MDGFSGENAKCGKAWEFSGSDWLVTEVYLGDSQSDCVALLPGISGGGRGERERERCKPRP